ncbi:MAG: HAMP domain-containing histidine kinase [Nitrospinota bacterium]|nr:HAMP domain-containing histidine kinase [Nitrospinota bacterium]
MLTLLRSGLFRRLFAATMMVTVFIIIASLVSSSLDHEKNIRRETELRHDTVAKRMALEMALFFDHASLQLTIMADMLKYMDMENSFLSAALNDISLDAPHFTDIAIKDMEGRDMALSVISDRPSLQVSTSTLESAFSDNKWISDVRLDDSRVPFVEMVAPIFSGSRPIGMVVARLSLKKLWFWIDEINTESNTSLTVVKTDNGLVIADQEKEIIGKTFPQWRKDRGSHTVHTPHGPLYISFHQVPGVDLTIVTQSRMDTYYGYLSRSLYQLIFSGVGLVMLAAVMSATFSARASRPVYQLIYHMNRYAEFGGKIPAGLEGEYGRIADAFNHVAEKLEENQRTIVAQESLVTVGRVSAILAHELRHELQMINNMVYVMDMAKEEKDSLHRTVNDMANKISSIMELARGSRIDPAEYLASELLEETLDYVQMNYVRKGVEVALEDDPSVRLKVDRMKVTMALSNLARNAMEAGADRIRLGCHAVDGFVIFSVADNGRGISADVLDRILEPFFTTKQKGYGLGLAFVNSVAKAHGGHLLVENQANGGALFQVHIPLSGVENEIIREQPRDAAMSA